MGSSSPAIITPVQAGVHHRPFGGGSQHAPAMGPASASAGAPTGGPSGLIGGPIGTLAAGMLSAASTPSSADPASGPSAFGDLAANPVAAIAMQQGKQFVQSSVAKYLPGAVALWNSLHFYFHVDNKYVQRKLKRILFPFTHKQWERRQSSQPLDANASGPSFAAPVEDDNAPDLYIPLMAFITYVLAMGLLKGIGMKFHPEVLSQVMSSTLVVVILEVVLTRGALYLLSVSSAGLLDLVAYSGYKYVGLVVNLMVGIFLGRTGYYLALLYTGGCMLFFMMNTLFPIVRPDHYSGGAGGADAAKAKSQRSSFAIGASVFQLLLMWWMGSTGELA